MDSGPPPGVRAMTYRELLATRVLSVDAYWRELRDPSRRTPREIPVPLWPGESLQQYEREFGRWLAARRLSLVAMREDPVVDRNYRLQFAHTRVARPSDLTMSRATSPPRVPRLRSRSPSRSPLRVARPSGFMMPRSVSPPRAPRLRSRSRSISRSPPPRRRFGGIHQLQQRPHPIQREDRGYIHDRRPSPDNGRQFAVRQRPDRSYSRERAQATRGHTAPPEAPRMHDNGQDQRSSEPRPRLDTQMPPPQQRQNVGDTYCWNRSPSRSPKYYTSRGTSPQRSDWHSSQVRKSASPRDQARSNVDHLRKQLLARRVVSVEAFRDEMHKLRYGLIREDDLKRPNETMVRIPVILWPGETMPQYTQKFQRWLDSRNILLGSLRDNPARERSLWHTFAYTRAGASNLGEPVHPGAVSRSPPRMSVRSRSRSRSRSSSRSIRRNSERGRLPMPVDYGESKLIKREIVSSVVSSGQPPRRERSYSPIERHRSRSPPSSSAPPENPRLFTNKTRRQLLERRILALDVFQKEVEGNTGAGAATVTDGNILPAIPVPLYPGESMGLYDHRFWTWLKDFNDTKESLRGNPARERRFRMAFAYLRVNKPHASTTASGHSVEAQKAQDPRPNVDAHQKIPLGVLKSARARLAMSSKRPGNDNDRNVSAQIGEPSSKRARTDVAGKTHVTSDLPSSHSQTDPEPRGKSTLSVESYHSVFRLSLAPKTSAASARPSSSMAITASSSPLISAPSARASTSLSASASALSTSIAPSTKTATASSPAGPAQLSTSSQAPAVPTTAPTRVPSRPVAVPLQRKPREILAKPSALSAKVPISPSVSAPAQKTNTIPAATPPSEAAKTSFSTAGSRKMAAVVTEGLNTAVSRNNTVKPVDAERRPSDNNSSAGWNFTWKPVDLGASRPLLQRMQWSAPASVVSTSAPYSVTKLSSSSSSTSTSSTARAVVLTAQTSTTAPSPTTPSTSTTTTTSTRTTTIVSSQTTSRAGVSTTKATPSVNAVENDLADTDAAVSEPDMTPAKSAPYEVSNTESSTAEEHDGDVMDPDGCCCTKCMRSWAKTLTDRMDQLERSVGDLKREVINGAGVQAATVTG